MRIQSQASLTGKVKFPVKPEIQRKPGETEQRRPRDHRSHRDRTRETGLDTVKAMDPEARRPQKQEQGPTKILRKL